MTQKIIFMEDVDNVTIQLNPEDKKLFSKGTVEIVDDFHIPDETDTHYVDSENHTMRHRDSGATWEGIIYKLKERYPSVPERLHDLPTFDLNNLLAEQGKITIKLEDKFLFSAVDDESFMLSSQFDYNQNGDKYNLSDYANARLFNQANSSKTFDIVSHKRYSKGEGHPVVESTTIQVPYPTLGYMDNLYTLVLKKEGDLFRFSTNYETDDRILEKLIVEQKPILTINFEITLEDETTHHGVLTRKIGSLSFAEPDLAEYSQALGKSLSSPVKSGYLNVDVITIEGFEGRFAITFDSYVLGNS